jgi:hypothetical protein
MPHYFNNITIIMTSPFEIIVFFILNPMVFIYLTLILLLFFRYLFFFDITTDYTCESRLFPGLKSLIDASNVDIGKRHLKKQI